MTSLSFFTKLKRLLLEYIFPQTALVRKLENMSLSELSSLPRVSSYPLDWVHPIFSYKDRSVREIIRQIKFKGNVVLAEKMAEILAEEIQAFISETVAFTQTQTYTLIPIPLSKERVRNRGFNQVDLVGKEIARCMSEISYRTDILIRKKNTSPQTNTRSRTERLKNIKDCFAVQKSSLPLKTHILLLDDVTTTGATLAEAQKALRRAGFKHISAFTCAH